jgi:Domain of unknown function (DUF4105)
MTMSSPIHTSLRKVLRIVALVLLACVVFLATAWGSLAVYYSDLQSELLRAALAVVFCLWGVAALVLFLQPRWRWRAAMVYVVLFAGLVAWWSRIPASNDREWKSEVAVLPYATQSGDQFTMHNIRNFDYRSETDFTPAYYDKTFDLRQLESVDLIASYWAGPAIAHIFLSFGFGHGDYLAISIERRDERTESYSTLKGLFKQYELYYVVADERDVIRVRTNYRRDPPEQTYIYRTQAGNEGGRRLLGEYLREINSLHDTPEFYNTVTANCTNNIWLHARVNPGRVPYSWKVLVSGYLPEYLYEQQRFDTRVPFEELKERGHINALAKAADQAPDFSTRIRAHIIDTASQAK